LTKFSALLPEPDANTAILYILVQIWLTNINNLDGS
jgi:hypothetical protein